MKALLLVLALATSFIPSTVRGVEEKVKLPKESKTLAELEAAKKQAAAKKKKLAFVIADEKPANAGTAKFTNELINVVDHLAVVVHVTLAEASNRENPSLPGVVIEVLYPKQREAHLPTGAPRPALRVPRMVVTDPQATKLIAEAGPDSTWNGTNVPEYLKKALREAGVK